MIDIDTVMVFFFVPVNRVSIGLMTLSSLPSFMVVLPVMVFVPIIRDFPMIVNLVMVMLS